MRVPAITIRLWHVMAAVALAAAVLGSAKFLWDVRNGPGGDIAVGYAVMLLAVIWNVAGFLLIGVVAVACEIRSIRAEKRASPGRGSTGPGETAGIE
jgi:hypothetical protein